MDPYLKKEKSRLVSETCEKIRLSGVSPILCMDVGHSSARNSQAATLAAACGSLLVFTLTDTTSNAWAKEAVLVGRALTKAIDEEKMDVSMVEIDDNQQNAGLITACRRVNGPEEMRDEPVKCAIDVFRAVKSLSKNAMKVSADNLKKPDVYFKDCCKKEVDANAVVELLDKALVRKADSFFRDILESFSSCGAEEWRDASSSPASMNTFARERKVLDIQHNGTVWEPVISAWNSTMKVTKAVKSISSMKVNDNAPVKTLKLLVAGVSIAVGVASPIFLAGGTKTQMLEFLKIHLPEICFRGSNFCVNLDDALSEMTTSMLDSSIDVQTSHIVIGLQTLSTIFGIKEQSFSEMKKLKIK